MKNLVFVVEDNPVQQKMLQVHFEENLQNYAVRTFSNPDELMTHLKEKPFAIVLDHFFGEKRNPTGLDFMRELRKKSANVPVIYYTTLNDEKVKNEVMELGAEQYILKDSASLVRLRTALDAIHQKSKKKGVLGRLFGK